MSGDVRRMLREHLAKMTPEDRREWILDKQKDDEEADTQ